MSIHRFKLGSLQCVSPRSKSPYADWLMVTLVAVRNGEMIGSVSSVIGDGPGSRALIPFNAGSPPHDFTPTFFGSGTNRVWEVAFEVAPGLPDVELRVVIANIRDIDDPYALARFSIALAALGVSVTAGVFLGEKFKEVLAKIASDPHLQAIAEKILGEAWDLFTDRLPGWLFGDSWPECAGDVLVWSRTVSGSDVADAAKGEMQITTAPETSASSSGGCRRPNYRLTAYLVDDSSFGHVHEPLRTRYVPCRDFSASLWEGIWQTRSAEVRAGIGPPRNRHYDVTAHEAFGIPTDATFPEVRETIEAWPYYVKDAMPEAKPALGTQVAEQISAGAASAALVSGNGASQGLGGLHAGRTGGLSNGVSLPEPPPAPPTSLAVRGDSDIVGRDDQVVGSLEQGVRTLTLPSGARLGLYTCIQEFVDGTARETGPFVRYMRDSTMSSTRSDVMLPRYVHIG